MSEHFIKKIEITTFKCFDHFEASEFKQANLIGGKNNIGKTELLETLSLNTGSVIIKVMIFLMFIYFYNRKLVDTCLYSSDKKNKCIKYLIVMMILK